jgi:DNA-binding NarL/FixJ family response regulator
MANIVLVDDHAATRLGLAAFLAAHGHQVVGQASSLAEAATLFGTDPPAAVILDIALNADWGLDLIAALDARYGKKKRPRVVVYSMFIDYAHVNSALAAGAQGYVCKTDPLEDLAAALTTVLAGKRYVAPQVAPKLVALKDTLAGLTKRERRVFDLAQYHSSNKDIAAKMGITVRTVENYLAIIYDKVGVRSRKELVAL